MESSEKMCKWDEEWNISFAGCGFRSIYYVGVMSCILEQTPWLVHGASQIGGASSGCLVAAALAVGIPIRESHHRPVLYLLLHIDCVIYLEQPNITTFFLCHIISVHCDLSAWNRLLYCVIYCEYNACRWQFTRDFLLKELIPLYIGMYDMTT